LREYVHNLKISGPPILKPATRYFAARGAVGVEIMIFTLLPNNVAVL